MSTKDNPLPGFGLTLGFTSLYLSLMVILPLTTLILKASTASPAMIAQVFLSPRVQASLRLSLVTSFIAASINLCIGLLVAWVLSRYSFPFKRLLDGLVDLPFALPTAVAGITLTTLYGPYGWLGKTLENFGIQVTFQPLGVILALVFVSFPFVVRTVEPVLLSLESELEEIAATMGASSTQIFFRIILPQLWPSLLTGFGLAFARALGEYGSVVFISGNLPFKTEVVPLLIMSKLEQFDYIGASVLAIFMLIFSLTMLLLINVLQIWSSEKC